MNAQLIWKLLGFSLGSSLCIVLAAYHIFGDLRTADLLTLELFAFSGLALVSFVICFTFIAKRNWRRSEDGLRELLSFSSRNARLGVLDEESFIAAARRMIAAIDDPQSGSPKTALLIMQPDQIERIRTGLNRSAVRKTMFDFITTVIGKVRHYDLVGEMGDGRIAVMLKNAGKVEADIVADRLSEAVKRRIFLKQGIVEMSASIGGVAIARQIPFADVYDKASHNLSMLIEDGGAMTYVSDMGASPISPSPDRSGGHMRGSSDGRPALAA